MKPRFPIAMLGLLLLATSGCRSTRTPDASGWADAWRATNQVWRGVHLAAHSDEQAAALADQLPKLKAAGVNVVIVEVDYSFDFQSHPELRPARYVTRAGARQLVSVAHPLGIRLIPQINCLGHQSWSKSTGELLRHYPQFDETPGQFPDNEGIYCRSWCPQNPEVNGVIFALIDEIADAFEADAFHVGMDEVFILASEHCSRCRGGDPAGLFARAVNDLHAHIVGKRKLEMLLWGDRLLDARPLGYSKWEASMNGTAGAADLIPKDIIVCDWHYGKQADYPSVDLLLRKGFRVWPSGWQPLEASKRFSAFARAKSNERSLGYLCTTWGKVKIADLSAWPPLVEPLELWR
ncbi:MAG TPA: family 20 glycosylhydrolase [Methylomirabilota bacterium]|nr:family 20 glycosylhydrolase [Methylomirabilota bacterium]